MNSIRTEDQMSFSEFRNADVAQQVMQKKRLDAILLHGEDPSKLGPPAVREEEEAVELQEEGIMMDGENEVGMDPVGIKVPERRTSSILSSVSDDAEGVLEIRMSDINVRVPVYRGSVTEAGAAFFISQSQSLSLRIGLELTIVYNDQEIPVMYVGGSFPFPEEQLVLLSFMRSQPE